MPYSRILLPTFLATIFAALLPLLVPQSSSADVTAQEPYGPAPAALEKWLQRELELKKIPCLSIALVDDQKVVGSRGFGSAGRHAKMAAAADTVYRVGSVS